MNPSTEISFIKFIWQPENRKTLLKALGITVVLFIGFKLLYPYPDFFSDSYSYLFAAYANLDISIWPIGYSKFLRAFHHITYSDTALVGVQYLLVQLAALYLFFTILYFYTVSAFTRRVIFIFLFINPLTLYLCNTINSDALFGALSIAWFTQLLWIVQRPRVWMIFSQAVLLFLCFTIRNNAYYYPLVAVVAFLLSRRGRWYKLGGIVMPLFLLVPFILWTQNKAYQLTGTRQFSLFTGWQLANNALYIYDQVSVDPDELPTPQAKELNKISVEFFRHVKPDVYRDVLESYVGNFFIRQPEAPLKTYYSKYYQSKTELEGVAKWGKASADMEPFGKVMILHNPIAYMRYFVWPNVFHYFVPPLSHLEQYNYGENKVEPIASFWFHYPSTKLRSWSTGFQGIILLPFTAFFLLFNGYFIWQLWVFTRRRGFRDKSLGAGQWITLAYLVLNFGFSLVATVNILRYQFLPMVILLSFALLASDWLEEVVGQEKKQFKAKPENSALYRVKQRQIL
ncbi:MAG TPA: hypothetical protein VK563_06410 [Puia sp.]|nr:hypothetical protein [Puia sp.]